VNLKQIKRPLGSKYVSHPRWQVALVLHDICTNNDGLLIHAFSRGKNVQYTLKLPRYCQASCYYCTFEMGHLKC